MATVADLYIAVAFGAVVFALMVMVIIVSLHLYNTYVIGEDLKNED